MTVIGELPAALRGIATSFEHAATGFAHADARMVTALTIAPAGQTATFVGDIVAEASHAYEGAVLAGSDGLVELALLPEHASTIAIGVRAESANEALNGAMRGIADDGMEHLVRVMTRPLADGGTQRALLPRTRLSAIFAHLASDARSAAALIEHPPTPFVPSWQKYL